MRAFRATLEQDVERATVVSSLSNDTKLTLYAGLLRARLHDIQLKRWVRTGVISKAWLGTGEEATTVGPVHALERGRDIVAPMIRNAAACCELGLPVAGNPLWAGPHDRIKQLKRAGCVVPGEVRGPCRPSLRPDLGW